MNKFIRYLFLIFLTCQCSTESNLSEIEKLPPPTKAGERTFGCLLDGKAFVPRLSTSGSLEAVYHWIDGKYYFGLEGSRRDADNFIVTIALGTNGLEIAENQSYELDTISEGNFYGLYKRVGPASYTGPSDGEVTITKFDQENNIVSGTFNFDVIDGNGVLHEIREGRFDMLFTE